MMPKISQTIQKTTPDDWAELYNIQFVYREVNAKRKRFILHAVQNIITLDTESSNGFRVPGSDRVVGFDQERYDRGLLVSRSDLSPDDMDANADYQYMQYIDACEPVGLMYLWQVAIEDGFGGIKAFIGRTWEDLRRFMDLLTGEIVRQQLYGFKAIDRDAETAFSRQSKSHIITYIWVHNLGHDWHFLLNEFKQNFITPRKDKRKWGRVFARKSRKPMKAVMSWAENLKFEFRDTLVLAQKSLKTWAKDCPNCPLEKLEDFDYLTIKTPLDTLTPTEVHYALNDVLIMVYCLEYEREAVGVIQDIPLTQTGKVRKICRGKIANKNFPWQENCQYMQSSYTPDEYKKRMWLFQGGYVHACRPHVGEILQNCRCFDFASSYPSALTTGKYPVFGYQEADVAEFDTLRAQDPEDPQYRWFARLRLKKVRSILAHTFFSFSKCLNITGYLLDNGRVMVAESMEIYILDLDWFHFQHAYAWDELEVLEVQKGVADFLPVEFITCVLDYYAYKTSLKGVDDAISLYIESKQFINGIYGVGVYKVISDQPYFTEDGWQVLKVDDGGDKLFYDLMKSQKKEGAFTFFDIGMICAAIARKRLWDFISAFDSLVWYCDTDSIKGDFSQKELDFIADYNGKIAERENSIAAQLGFDPALYAPLTAEGKPKRLGIMEREADCSFKTLGAKRYIADHGGEIECTIAGLPKKAGADKIKKFDDFTDCTLWTTAESHKITCYYNDDQPATVWTGRDGVEYHSHDKYGVCLKPATFDLSLTDDFKRLLNVLASGTIDPDDDYFADTPAYLLTIPD